MTPDDRGQRLRQVAVVGGISFLVAALIFAAVGIAWVIDFRAPRVTLLGAGEDALSVLVTAGNARLLIATGDDPAAFSTALERARHPLSRRLDIVLLTGTDRDLLAPATIAGQGEARYLATLGTLPPSPESTVIRAAGATPLTTAKRFQLDDNVVVDLDLASAENGNVIWRAVVRRHATSVVVLSRSEAADLFTWPGPASALVISGGDNPLAAWEQVPAPLLAFPDGAVAGPDLRQAVAGASGPDWAVRVFPAEAIRLTLGQDGLELAPAAADPLSTAISSGRR